jgi:hypothetical protein
MLHINENLKDKIIELNSILNKNYEIMKDIHKDYIRGFILDNIGKIGKLQRLSTTSLQEYHREGGIVGVDGSRNRLGGAYPHFVEVFQGLAKSTNSNNKPVYLADFYTPLYLEKERDVIASIPKDNPSKEEIDSFIRNYRLSSVELEVAIEAVEKLNPCVIMMDGSLIRYKIECGDKWNKLKSLCEDKRIILIGVIKDIKTSIIGHELVEKGVVPPSVDYLYDRELLYGTLEFGEMVTIDKINVGKEEEGLSSCFIRTSMDPAVVGMDILNSQVSFIKEMAQLVFTLTPRGSRGVPLWLDIVDSEVKISDAMMKALLEKYIDRHILEKLLISERSKRTL